MSGPARARGSDTRLVARLDALRDPRVAAMDAASSTQDEARNAIDGQEETVWSGRPGERQWRWTSSFASPVHLGLLRAHFGRSPALGVPTRFRWEGRRARGESCAASDAEDGWFRLPDTDQTMAIGAGALAQPTRRSWFIDADVCGVRLVVDQTNAGPPVLREVQAIESARDVLRDGHATGDADGDDYGAARAIGGTYSGRWAGAPTRSRWTLRVDLARPTRIDRVRLVLGYDATGAPRPEGGRSYAVTWAPIHYTLEASRDGEHFTTVATDPVDRDGASLMLRRRLLRLSSPVLVRALRLVMRDATGSTGLPEPGAVPVVRELAAYAADDPRPVLARPWILSVNANPSRQSRLAPGGEATNDAYYASFLRRRLAGLVTTSSDPGAVVESIEGDDPRLEPELLARSSPPPIVVLSGSNDWDYAPVTGPDQDRPARWHWNPLRDARAGGMGRLAPAVKGRVAPFLGFCGGAQILALLEARQSDDPERNALTMDRVLERTTGRPVRGFALPFDLDRAWPTEPAGRRAAVRFSPDDPLFIDMAGPTRRSTSYELPEWHADAVRPDAFVGGGPLERFELVAASAFCAPGVVDAGPRDGSFPDPTGAGWCDTIPEVFRSREPGFPVIGAQFHAEQRDFPEAAPGDPPEATADPELFLAAEYEQAVNGYLARAR